MQTTKLDLSMDFSSEILANSRPEASSSPLNFKDGASLHSKKNFDSDFFSLLRPLSQKLSVENDLQDKNEFILPQNYQPVSFLAEEYLFDFLELKKGTSQDWDQQQEPIHFQAVNCALENSRETHLANSRCFLSQSLKGDEEGRNNSRTVSSEPPEIKSVKRVSHKLSTKNITKNMSKLLLKWIWKNHKQLKHQLQYQNEVWETFISRIKVWKRLNNLTRQFLVSKWHSEGEESRLFRILSLHFFRRHCLPSIMESNIENKLMHVEKISKFLEGVKRPEGLDSLS